MACHAPISVTFHRRLSKNKRNDCSVYACIKIPGYSSKEILAFKNLKKEAWDIGYGKPKNNEDYLIKLTLLLDQIKAKLFEIYFDLKKEVGEVSPDNIKAIYTGSKESHYTVLSLVGSAIDKYAGEVSPGTLKNYNATKSYIKAFCRKKYKKGDISLKYLTRSFIDELKTYILNNPIKSNDPCTNNGCMKHMERLKKIMTWAFEMKFIDRNVFNSFKVKKSEFKSEILYPEQLRSIEEKCFYRPMLDKVRDLFVFSCYTGLAPIDIQRLTPHQIYTDSEGTKWLSYTRVKSKISASIPLLKQASMILKKYGAEKGNLASATIFPFISNQVINRNLKIISEILELGVKLNFYIARHTFATTVLLANDVPVTSIKAMMGHKRFESTLHYAKPLNHVVSGDMKKLQNKLDAYKFDVYRGGTPSL